MPNVLPQNTERMVIDSGLLFKFRFSFALMNKEAPIMNMIIMNQMMKNYFLI